MLELHAICKSLPRVAARVMSTEGSPTGPRSSATRMTRLQRHLNHPSQRKHLSLEERTLERQQLALQELPGELCRQKDLLWMLGAATPGMTRLQETREERSRSTAALILPSSHRLASCKFFRSRSRGQD